MSNSKKHVLSIAKSKKKLSGQEYDYFTLLCDGDYCTSDWFETLIVLYAINLYLNSASFEFDKTLAFIFDRVVDVCNCGLKVLPNNVLLI